MFYCPGKNKLNIMYNMLSPNQGIQVSNWLYYVVVVVVVN